MTEIYHGQWDPVTGDRPETTVPNDPYHPKYPDAGPYKKAEGLGEKPTTNADQFKANFVRILSE